VDKEELKHAVSVATEDLREAIERLEEEEFLSGDDVDQFVYKVQNIIGFLELAAGISYNDKEVT